MNRGMPNVRVLPDTAVIAGGMDAVTSPMMAKPGSARLAYNYEYSINGGIDRIHGIEPFDGRPAPSDADYTLVKCVAAITLAVGATVTGATSAATGVVLYVASPYFAMTRVSGTFVLGENLQVSSTTFGVAADLSPAVDGFLDNRLSKLAADNYQADITKPTGAGPVRGIGIVADRLFAWRNNVGQTAAFIYEATSSGWTLVNLGHQVSFTAGSSVYAEGSTLTQGGTTATVKRVVLESGAWGTSNAAGRLIISAPSGGVFSAGAATGGGAVTLSGASAAITLSPGGRVRTDRFKFTASQVNKRLYGCDGVNPEFEFDGDVYVPLNTGMASIRATAVRCHKNHVFFGYQGSMQHSSIAFPYQWSAVTGAAELATGDTITNFVPVGGAQDSAALMVTCVDSIHVLYGNSSADWNLVTLSRVSGAKADSTQDIGGVYALDTPGVVYYPATRSFGNFAWDTASMAIQPYARDQDCSCSVFASGQFKYRIFFKDGTAISGLPLGPGKFAWSVIDYGRNIVMAEHAEINGDARTFYADDQGWVYEADKGRSFAGEPIPHFVKLQPLNQRSPMVEKTFRQLELETSTESAITLYTAGEFGGTDNAGPTEESTLTQYGPGAIWDMSAYDQSYWDVGATQRKMLPFEGTGTNATILVQGRSDNELPHTLFAVTVLYTPRRMSR